MARGRAVVRGRAGARLLLRLALIVACSKGRTSTAPAATRLRPAAREAALDWSAYADPQTASQRFRVRTHEPSAAFSSRSRACCRTALAGAWSGEWRSRSWSGAGCASPLLPAVSAPPPVPRCERLRRRWAQEEVFIVGRGSPSLVGTVGTWCGALRAPGAGQAFARAGAHRCRPQPRAGTGPSATSESRTSSREEPAARQTQLLAATRSLTWCCACRSPPAPRCGNERSGCGLASTVRAMHTRAVLCPSLVPSPVAAGSRSPRGRRSGSGSVAGPHRRAASLLVERGAPACKIVACETGTAASCRGGAHSRRRAGECAQA